MRINTNILVLGLLALIVVGSLSLFTNPYPVIDFSLNTDSIQYLVIPERKEVVHASIEIIPDISSVEGVIPHSYDYSGSTTTYYGLYIKPSKSLRLKSGYFYDNTYWELRDTNYNTICSFYVSDNPSSEFNYVEVPFNCVLEEGVEYYLYPTSRTGFYETCYQCYISTSYFSYSDNTFHYIICDSVTSCSVIESLNNWFNAYDLSFEELGIKDLIIKIDDQEIYNHAGELTITESTQDFAYILNSYCNRPSNNAECVVPITFSVSQLGGKIQINDTILLRDLPEETSLSSTTEPKLYQYRAFSKTTKIRSFRETIAERIKSIFSIFRKPSEPTLAYNTYGVSSEQQSNEEPPICKIIRIKGVCA